MDNKFSQVAESEADIIYKGTLLVADKYSLLGESLNFSLNNEELQRINESFIPINLCISHRKTIFDSRIGQLTQLYLQDSLLSAKVEISKPFAKLLGDEIFIGAEIDRETKMLVGASINARKFEFNV